MHFAVMRAEKVRSIGHLVNLVRHATRELPPENADPALRHLNRTLAGANTADGVMGDFRQLWPQKRRKDAVLAIEYVMSASHEWWEQASTEQKTDFVHSSMHWLEEKYGAENIVSVVLHRDERTPHLSVFLAPVKNGKLNASQYIGNRSKMASDQTSYADCLKHLGIVRGIEKSQAEHVKPSEFYAQLNRSQQLAKHSVDQYLQQVELPEAKFTDLKNIADFIERVARAASEPLMKLLKAQQLRIDQLKQKIADREATLDEYRRLYGAFFNAIDAIPSPIAKKRVLAALSDAVSTELLAEEVANRKLDDQVEYVAQRLQEDDSKLSPLRARHLAESMQSAGDPKFKEWLQTPPAVPQSSSEHLQEPVEKASTSRESSPNFER